MTTVWQKLAIFVAALSLNVQQALANVTPIATFDLARSTALKNAEWNFSKMLPIVMSVYSDPIGEGGQIMVYGAILVIILTGVAIRQESVLIPMVILEIFALTVYWNNWVPSGWGLWIIALMYLLPAVAVFYALFSTKRKG